MRTFLLAATLAAAAVPALAQTNVSVTIGDPNFYGRIDIGNFAPPPVVYAQPVIVQRVVRYEPPVVYLRVPPGHQKHWDKFCGRYNACGQRVYFVRDDWYLRDYAPRYREEHGRPEWAGHGRGHDEGHGHGHDEGHGRGHGHD
jgi:hypothetical protein